MIQSIKKKTNQIRPNEDFYSPSIGITNNQIEICPSQNTQTNKLNKLNELNQLNENESYENKENKEIKQINIIKDLINQPNTYKLYQIKYQQKQYEITFEVLFALIIDQFKQNIEKKYIIDETIVIAPTRDNEAIRRI